MTFAEQSGGECDLFLTMLNYTADNVVMGGMFFQEFFGVFRNNYTQAYNANQTG
jgi:hypothetical protein